MGTITSRSHGLFSIRRIFLHFLLLLLSSSERDANNGLVFFEATEAGKISDAAGPGLLTEDMAGAVCAGTGFAAGTGALADSPAAEEAWAEALVAAPPAAAGEDFAAVGVLADAGDTGAEGEVLGADGFAPTLPAEEGTEALFSAPGAGFAAGTGALANAGDTGAVGNEVPATFLDAASAGLPDGAFTDG